MDQCRLLPAFFESWSKTLISQAAALAIALLFSAQLCVDSVAAEVTLLGHWKLEGDCRDYSGRNLHGVNRGVDLEQGAFDGRGAHIEVPATPALNLGTNDFSISLWFWTEEQLDDVLGDLLEWYDPAARQGITLCLNSNSSGYQGQGSDRQVYFGIDQGRMSEWQDCGRPSPTSRYVSNSMLVFDGSLYAAVTDAEKESDWARVYKYAGGQRWIDCGRVGNDRTPGVGPLLVHEGQVYAVTWTYDWTRVRNGGYDPSRVFRYAGGTNWLDLGQPGANRTMNCAASFKGKLYVGGGPETWAVYASTAGTNWQRSIEFPKEGPRRCFPHAMSRYNGKLYTAYPGVYGFDGVTWDYAGLPGPLDTNPTLQTHSLAVFRGKLMAGTWPEGNVAAYESGEQWKVLGRVGVDGSEVNSLLVYNGKLYGGSIPRAEVCRFDDSPAWTSLRRFYSPDGWRPALPGKAKPREVHEWSRVTSMTIYQGRLFASIGNCTSAAVDSPADVRGRVFSFEAGKCVSSDRDLGPGWKHLAALRAGDRLKLFVDGKLAATSSAFRPEDYSLTPNRPLLIGAGQTDSFNGKLRDVRLYAGALSEGEIARIAAQKPR